MRAGSMVLAYSTHQFVRRLSRRYYALLAVIAVLVIVHQAVINPLRQQASSIAPSITLADRQQLLGEHLAKTVLAINSGFDTRDTDDQRQEIEDTLQIWLNDHAALENQYFVPQMSPELAEQWNAMRPHFEGVAHATSQVVALLQHSEPEAEAMLKRSDAFIASSELLLNQQSQFQSDMSKILSLLGSRSHLTNARLEIVELAIGGSILLCVGVIGWLVLRPATKRIRQQVKDLEHRIRERTHELEKALKSLRHETKQREAVELKSKQLAIQLSNADRAMTMGQLSLGIARELKQPLAAIINSADSSDKLLEPPSSKDKVSQARTLMSSARQAAQRISQSLRRISNFVRPQSGDIVSTDLHKLVHEIAELMRFELAANHTNLQLQLVATKRMINADPIQIQQVLVNLLQNSMQAMQASNRTHRTITIKTSTGDETTSSAVACTTDGRTQNVLRVVDANGAADSIRLEIIDTGPGFEADDVEELFLPLSTNAGDRLGLGLSICRSIIENHHGKIWIARDEHRGAHIIATLPTIEATTTTAPTPTDSVYV